MGGSDSFAEYVNQVVGASRLSLETGELRAFLWENGGPLIDLKTLIPADSALNLVGAERINDRIV